MRNTMQRSGILEAVKALPHHATAEEIYTEVHRQYPSISKATVYRNLNLLVEEGLLCRVCAGRGPDRYDAVLLCHYHLRCDRCGKIMDAEMEPLKNPEKELKNAQGFQVTGHEVIFRGVCADCLAKKGGNEEDI